MQSKDQTIYTNHLVYRRNAHWWQLSEENRQNAAAEVQEVIDRYQKTVTLRGAYSTVGFRNDADAVFWLLSNEVDALQDFAVDLRRTAFGQAADLVWAFPGLTRPPEFVGDHLTSFQKELPPLKYLCLYPFVRTSDWYLMPKEERGKILREHGMMGREFPEVHTNNVQAFGIGDYEWILAFETEQYERFVDLVRRLREAEARKYTKLDVPFVIGVRKEIQQLMQDFAPETFSR